MIKLESLCSFISFILILLERVNEPCLQRMWICIDLCQLSNCLPYQCQDSNPGKITYSTDNTPEQKSGPGNLDKPFKLRRWAFLGKIRAHLRWRLAVSICFTQARLEVMPEHLNRAREIKGSFSLLLLASS